MREKGSILLQTENLCVGYQKKAVVGDICFSVKRGEILTLIGPNGSGKSTILRSIASQLELLGGRVWLNERNLAEQKEREIAKQLSVMLTNRIHTERMTCRDVVESGRYPYTNLLGILSGSDREAVADAMCLTGVTGLSDCDISKISDGQRQRVLLAKAVCQEPDVLVLDEPTSFLDIRHKLELLHLLKQLVCEKEIGVVMSLHELDLAMKISDKVLCIRDGKADRYGTAEEIFTASYIERLYGIETGSFQEMYGSSELPAIAGEPEVFVIGGGGTAVSLYRRLQRMHIPFAAGVLHENDVEYPVASALASVLIAEKAFEPVSDSRVETALQVLSGCKKLLCTIPSFGTMNKGNEKLLRAAEAMQIQVEMVPFANKTDAL